MKKMLGLVIAFCISIFSVSGQSSLGNSDIEFVSLGFYAIPNSSFCNQLLFRIHNNTNDTLYIPVKDIKVEVSKDNKMLKQDSIQLHNLIPASLDDEFLFFMKPIAPLKSVKIIRKRKLIVDKLKRTY
ncbi:hypothetical protein [Mucilaginibacter auburnensis]|uniref:Uncharacterized protein n=1 Tax=Mucilaginibacter auburnensis TaxID=1457233 RepID=A0A2H9VTG5_9SPHI|nr:hypothetical protein [Mucilaginibacter auburnensis]PJJ84117.1 hypothetical protein CLV57_1121 [Mucilaginibacter auburnensis]